MAPERPSGLWVPQPANTMKSLFLRSLSVALSLTLAGSLQAEHVVYRGTTVNKTDGFYYYTGSGETLLRKWTQTQMMIAIISTLGGPGYALYILDQRNKQFFRYSGDFAKGGPVLFPNIDGRGKALELHRMFNAKWSEDLADLGDDKDVFNSKTGMLTGNRSQIPLREAGFKIDAAPSLKGLHLHMRYSSEFAPLDMDYLGGRFAEHTSSKSTFRFDVKLSDRANYLGGSLANAMSVVEDELQNQKQFTLIDMGSLAPF
jgi:hypothetical protein